jgi:hypothetical protein
MRWLARWKFTLRSLFRHSQVDAELEDEFRDHLEREIESNVRAGMSANDARLAALRLIGPIAFHKEECRDARATRFIETFARDLRYAIRMSRRSPLFAGGGDRHARTRRRREHDRVYLRREHTDALSSGSKSPRARVPELGKRGQHVLSQLR